MTKTTITPAHEVAGFMSENGWRYSNGNGYRDGVGSIENFLRDTCDRFAGSTYGLFRDSEGLLCGGRIRLADGSSVVATVIRDWYGITKGWTIREE